MSQNSCDDEDQTSQLELSSIDTPGGSSTATVHQENNGQSKRSCWKRPTTWNITFNGILALTTVFLGCIAYQQLKSSNLDQRAWVGPTSFIHPVGESVYFREGSQPSFGVVITNNGRTPARNLHVMIQRQTFPKGTPFDAKYSDEGGPESTAVLFPNQTFNLTTKPESRPLTARQVEMITTGEFTLYVFGMVTYEDVFGIKHRTTFCGYLTPDLTAFQTCSTYNGID